MHFFVFPGFVKRAVHVFAAVRKILLYKRGDFCYTAIQPNTVRRFYGGGTIEYAPVAQLDRVTDSDSVGHWFESSRAYQIPLKARVFRGISLH